MAVHEQTKGRSRYLEGKVWLSVIAALVGAMATLTVDRLHFPFFSTRPSEITYVVHVVDASTNAPISSGLVIIEIGADRFAEHIDSQGSAMFRMPSKAIGQTVTLRVEAAGFTPDSDVIVLTREGTTLVPISRARAEKPPSDAPVLVPYTEVISSGQVPSGAGGNFSSWYEVDAPPPKPGFVIDPAESSYYLVGDRHCDAWSECVWGDHSPAKLSFRFRLQGHSEYPPPGIAMSQGFLKVVYKPE
jgi:hypothetical protein